MGPPAIPTESSSSAAGYDVLKMSADTLSDPALLLALFCVLLMIFCRLPTVRSALRQFGLKIGAWIFLKNSGYRLVQNAAIPDRRGGTIRLDNVLVSRCGIFVVAIVPQRGVISGGPEDRGWNCKRIGEVSRDFDNPLISNRQKIEYIADFLELSPRVLKSLVLFPSFSTFKSVMPANVQREYQALNYVRHHCEQVLTDAEVKQIAACLKAGRLIPGVASKRSDGTRLPLHEI